jgi:hypothetical protein
VVPAAGSYTVKLLVSDRDGASAVATATIHVRERPPEPIAPFPLVNMVAAISDRGTEIHALVVRAPRGARIRIRCHGRGCPFRKLSRIASPRASRLVHIRRFEGHLLRPATVVQIWVTKPGKVGKYTRFVIRKGRPPKRVDRCLMPGSRRPVRCPSS